jgi:hypothetical protein
MEEKTGGGAGQPKGPRRLPRANQVHTYACVEGSWGAARAGQCLHGRVEVAMSHPHLSTVCGLDSRGAKRHKTRTYPPCTQTDARGTAPPRTTARNKHDGQDCTADAEVAAEQSGVPQGSRRRCVWGAAVSRPFPVSPRLTTEVPSLPSRDASAGSVAATTDMRTIGKKETWVPEGL